jgi:hypothetical protein
MRLKIRDLSELTETLLSGYLKSLYPPRHTGRTLFDNGIRDVLKFYPVLPCVEGFSI